MKVLLLSPLPPPSGGIARWTERYLEWCKNKHQLTVVNTALQGERSGEAGKQRNLIDEIRRAAYIIRETRKGLKYKPDVVHINTSCSRFGIMRDWICVRIACKKRIPVILHCHCNIADQLGTGSIATNMFSDMVQSSHKVLVLNSSSGDYVKRINPEKVAVCPNFVLTEQIADSHKIKRQIEKVVYVGDVRLSKGSDDYYMLAKQNSNIEFVVVGSVTDEMSQLEKPQNVHTLGRLDAIEVQKQLSEADVFVFPSLTEGFSNALLEAMACGLPIIATDVGAAMDMIENCGGVVVPVHGIKEMQCALDAMSFSFTELVHTADCGQVSINISRPGITKGQHWHNSKWELFIVVAGHGLIQERNINTGETVEFEVSGDRIEAVHMIPGWTHNIINLSETENLVTVMTCNEIFDPKHPDTFFEPV